MIDLVELQSRLENLRSVREATGRARWSAVDRYVILSKAVDSLLEAVPAGRGPEARGEAS